MKRKWIIHTDKVLSPREREEYWSDLHVNSNYENVMSISEDPDVRIKIINQLNSSKRLRKVMVLGCGSRTELQRDLAANAEVEEVCCIDYPEVIEIAKREFSDPKVKYQASNLANLGLTCEYEAIVNVMSIVSENDIENRDILASSYEALKYNGIFIGFFPTIICPLEISLIDQERISANRIDLPRNTFFESHQGLNQIFYMPLRLRRIIKETGFQLHKMEIYFYESKYALEQATTHYSLSDEDMLIYGLYVVAYK